MIIYTCIYLVIIIWSSGTIYSYYISAPDNGTILLNGTMHCGLPALYTWPVGSEDHMSAYRAIIGKREIGKETGNE